MYAQLEASLHDLFWAAEGKNAELPLIEKFLQQYPGSALELGCGSGRLLLPLLEKGYLLEGLDNSDDMLKLCREKTGDLDPVLHQAGIEDFQTGVIYGAIIIPAFTLQLLPQDKLSAALANIHQHIQPGGGFYLTTFIPWAEITGDLEEGRWFLDQETTMPGGHIARCHTRFEIQRLSQKLTREHRYEIVSADAQILETSTSKHALTWYWPREMNRLLQHAGFTVQQVIGNFTADSPCDDNSQIVTVFASLDDDVSSLG